MNWLLLKNSLVVAIGVTLVATAVGFLVALCAVCLRRHCRAAIVSGGVVALLLPSFLVTNCWLHYFGVNGTWREAIPFHVYSMSGVITIMTSLYWPLPMLACLAAWRRLETTQLEADPALRGTWFIRLLLWPMARPLLGIAAFVVFVLALNNFAVPTILQTRVLAANVWISYNTNLDAVAAFHAGMPLIVAPLVLLVVAVGSGTRWPFRERLAAAKAFRLQVGNRTFWCAALASLVVLAVSVIFPLGHLVGAPETWNQLPLVLSATGNAILHSALYAVLTATVCVVLGFALWRARISGALWLAFLFPGMFVALLLIAAFNRREFSFIYGTAAMVVLACTIRYLALAWAAIRRAMATVDAELAEAARLEGARGWQLFRLAYWPQVAVYAGFGWYLIYVLCLWEVESLILVLPPGGETLAVRSFNMLHYGHTGQVNALCLVLLALAIIPLCVGWRCLSRSLRC